MAKKILWVGVLAFLIAAPSNAYAADSIELRLRLFDGNQRVCKWIVLRERSAASAFFRATTSSLSQICECAAALWVAERSDAELRAADVDFQRRRDSLAPIMEGHMREMAENVEKCVMLQ